MKWDLDSLLIKANSGHSPSAARAAIICVYMIVELVRELAKEKSK